MSQRGNPIGTPIERFTRMMFTRIITGLARTLRDGELSVGQVAALHLLDEQKASSVTALGDALGLSPSATSRLVDGLVQQGLVARAEDPEDRRRKTLMLTPSGQRFIEEASEDRVRVILATAGSLPAQVVAGFLSALAARFPEERPEDRPPYKSLPRR